MKREIKFRVYSQSLLVMYTPEKAKEFGGNLYNIPMMRDGVLIGDKDDIYMQFTGLKDKNGKEIYEGDILSIANGTNPIIARCEWIEGQFTLIDNGGGHWTRQLYHQPERLSIVGNIYENPELLK